ncbi:alpha-amylase, partial [Bittarella massiliensis]|nr:alpha-amylase [Bittarella massiliensis (ex Durand et al. 2017)]
SEGLPCVFYGDYYGIPHDGIAPMGHPLSALLWARQACAWGPQIDAFDDRDVVGWSRQGDPSHPGSGLCAVLTDGPGGQKRLFAGPHLAGKTLVDCLGGRG